MKTFSTMLKTELKLSLRGMDMFIFAICAGGVMGLPLVISDYRGKNILKRYKVTPVSPAMILLVQVTIYFLYAISSLFLLYFVAKWCLCIPNPRHLPKISHHL